MYLAGLLLSFVVSFGLLMVAVVVHEFAHGWVAYKLGDTTAKYAGRLTLNPLAHIDPFWTFIFPLFLFITSSGRFIFGTAKPVPINFFALRNPKRDIVWVGLSGPLANFISAAILSVIARKITLPSGLYFMSINLIAINVVLGVFNLIPIPPLDGSRILMGLLPDNASRRYMLIEPYGFVILILLIWMGLFNFIIRPLVGVILSLLGISF